MNVKRIVASTLCTLMVFQGFVSCMHRPSPVAGGKLEMATLDRVDVIELPDRLRIEVDGGRPMTYALATSTSPASVTVDLPGFSRGPQIEHMAINKGPIASVDEHDDWFVYEWNAWRIDCRRSSMAVNRW